MPSLLSVERLTKRYAAHTALDDVSLDVPEGSVYGLLGPNGAGKTTLIRIINRITAPDSGRVLFRGRELAQEDVARIGYLPEERGLYKKMRVGEQAIYFARLKGLSRSEATRRLRAWFEKFDILGWWDKRVEELSKGMAQKVQFIVTVLHEPPLLIFDEPFSGFDPVNANLLKDEMLALRDKGCAIIFSTHNMASVEEICDHIMLIDRSRNILSGPLEEVRRSYGESIWRLEYRGAHETLDAALKGLCAVVEEAPGVAALHIAEGRSAREMVAAINTAVEIRSLGEAVPSMNDIFIKAVSWGK
ncbi:MAG: ATP-binding cassette domain-containing protein [Rikenellaceae bacterium]|jgi:ABC-2 type transport system ATP-binding protein|nr:ATP-binding cassette domain-containing protein [Rikenellaceae bacterium]